MLLSWRLAALGRDVAQHRDRRGWQTTEAPSLGDGGFQGQLRAQEGRDLLLARRLAGLVVGYDEATFRDIDAIGTRGQIERTSGTIETAHAAYLTQDLGHALPPRRLRLGEPGSEPLEAGPPEGRHARMGGMAGHELVENGDQLPGDVLG